MDKRSPVEDTSSTGKEPIDVHQARTHAWLMALIAGQMDQTHPVHGSDLTAGLDGGVLVLKGSLPSQTDIDNLVAEAEAFRGRGIDEVRSELEVTESPDEEGLLVQTLIAAFESPDLARLAASMVENHLHLEPYSIKVLEPGGGVDSAVPPGFAPDVGGALDEGRSVLSITVDETAAFAARQVLEEETRSLWTLAAPPQPAPDRARRMDQRSESGQARAV